MFVAGGPCAEHFAHAAEAGGRAGVQFEEAGGAALGLLVAEHRQGARLQGREARLRGARLRVQSPGESAERGVRC